MSRWDRMFRDPAYPNDKFPKATAVARNRLIFTLWKEYALKVQESQVARVRQTPRGVLVQPIMDILEFGLGYLDVHIEHQRIMVSLTNLPNKAHCVAPLAPGP